MGNNAHRVTCFNSGTLSAVGSLTVYLQDGCTFLNWIAPFSLDIPIISVDITYCVDVINSTSSVTLHSECGINRTEYNFPVPTGSGCGGVIVTVTPVNVAGRGLPTSIQYNEALVGELVRYQLL